jgi:predicted Zn-dependent protease
MRELREDINKALANLLANPKVNAAIAKLKKLAEDNPEDADKLDALARAHKTLKDKFDAHCKNNPDSILCSPRFKKMLRSK